MQLPIYLSKIIFTEWIDVEDICYVDQSYCNRIYRSKIKEILNKLLINFMHITYDNNLFFDANIEIKKQKLFLNWLQLRNIYVKNYCL